MNGTSSDWKNEINGSYVRRFLWAHLLMWGFGFVLTLHSALGMLGGSTKKYLGFLALLIFLASLVGTVPIFGKSDREDHEGPVFSFRVFFIVFGFLISSGAYMWLLSCIGLHSIELW